MERVIHVDRRRLYNLEQEGFFSIMRGATTFLVRGHGGLAPGINGLIGSLFTLPNGAVRFTLRLVKDNLKRVVNSTVRQALRVGIEVVRG